jgi:predicted DNA-binding transcriptional regulator YafY
MRRTDRLFEIVQLFRGGRFLLGRDIAEKLEVSLRTIYRDIETLIASGFPIEGERGVGYILREPIFLPPLNMSASELEALHMGMQVVQKSTDTEMGDAAKRLLDKVEAVLPSDRQGRRHLEHLSVYINEFSPMMYHLAEVKSAIAQMLVVNLTYKSLSGEVSRRRVRPLQLEYWGKVWTCAVWCELRYDFRAFRVDQIQKWETTEESFSSEIGKRYKDYLARFSGK